MSDETYFPRHSSAPIEALEVKPPEEVWVRVQDYDEASGRKVGEPYEMRLKLPLLRQSFRMVMP